MNFVNAQIIARGGYIFAASDVEVVSIPCENVKVLGTEWFIPVVENGMFMGNYERRIIDPSTNTPPQADAFKTLRLHTIMDTQDIWILLENTGNEQTYTTLCNLCCDATDYDMPTVIIPDPIVEVFPCPVAPAGTATYTYNTPIPAQGGFNLTASFSANGVQLAALPNAAGYTTPALLLAAVITAWDTVPRVFSLQNTNTILRLVTTSDSSAGLEVTRVPKTFCYDILANTGDIVNQVTIGGVTTDIPQLTIDAVGNPQAIYFALLPILPGLQYVEDAGDADHPYLQYTGTIAPQSVGNAGAPTGTFTVGACF